MVGTQVMNMLCDILKISYCVLSPVRQENTVAAYGDVTTLSHIDKRLLVTKEVVKLPCSLHHGQCPCSLGRTSLLQSNYLLQQREPQWLLLSSAAHTHVGSSQGQYFTLFPPRSNCRRLLLSAGYIHVCSLGIPSWYLT